MTSKGISEKAEFSAWLNRHMKARNTMSQNALARLLDIKALTVNRWCNADDPTMPRSQTLAELSKIFGEMPPGFTDVGFQDDPPLPALTALPETPDDSKWNGNISSWQVNDDSMQIKGYVPGDTVKADARIQPVDGDVVVANLYDVGATARTALRVYKAPNYLLPATPDAAAFEVHEVGKTAAIFGVVFESIRRRAAH